MGKQMTNLGGAFCVWVVLKELMKREGRQPDDMNATGGCDGYGYLTTVKPGPGDNAIHDSGPDDHSSRPACHGGAGRQALRHGGLQ